VPRKPDSRPGSPAIPSTAISSSAAAAAAVPGSPLKSGDVQAQVQSAAPVQQLDIVKEAVEEGKEEAKKAGTPLIQVEALETPKAPVQIARTESNISASENEVFVDANDELPTEKGKEGEGETANEEKAETHAVKGLKETKESPKGDGPTKETKQEETKETLEENTGDQQAVISLNNGDHPSSVSASAPPPLPPRSRPAKEEPISEKEEDVDGVRDDADGAAENESDAQIYVGDATWEERTWRELTKLREEMFWARIGAVRS